MLSHRRILALAATLAAISAAAPTPGSAQRGTPVASATDLDVFRGQELQNRELTHRDVRLLTMRGINTVYALPSYPTRERWESHADSLRRQILLSAGLWPLPPRTPLGERIFGRVEREGYSVEKVYFQSHPNFYVAGNLYRPVGRAGPFPAILSPHGHFDRGRLVNTDQASVPARAINLARQGYVVLTYDMVGYDDTKQVNHTFASDSASQLWAINLLGLQLWDSMRALDLLRSLPDVDTSRIGITGASGGATQVFLLTALDTAGVIKAMAPVNMISAEMQGGDLCENAPGLRIGTFNVEIAALAAPRPLLMVSASGDWTTHTPGREYPMMRSLYHLYGAENRVENAHFDFPHNYNQASREAVYPWFARQLLGDTVAARYREQPIRAEPDSAVLVFLKTMVVDRKLTFADLPAGSYTPPPAALDEAGLKAYLRGLAGRQLRDAWPRDAASLASFRKLYGTGFRALLRTRLPEEALGLPRGSFAGSGYTGGRWLLSRPGEGDWTPAVWLRPASTPRAATILLSPKGKAILADPASAPLVRSLLAAGQSVLAPDLFLTGEHVLPAGTKTERDEGSNQFYTYNRTDTQERVHDVLTAIAFLRGQGVERINLVGEGDAGVWALLAASAAEDALDHVVAYGMDSSSDDDASGLRNLVPGLFKLGGVATAVALAAPTPVLVVGADPAFAGPRIPAAYAAAGATDGFRRAERGSVEEIVRWVTAVGGR
jgi:dienelactone hydrolase